jgi:hypothetical protein
MVENADTTETLTADLIAENLRFGEHRTELEVQLENLLQRALDCIFALYPDLVAIAWDISSNVCSDDVTSRFGGVLAANKVTTDHPATPSCSRLFEAVQVACDYIRTADCYEATMLATRNGPTKCVITEYDPREHNGSELLEMLSEGDTVPASTETRARMRVKDRQAAAITLTEADISDLADGARINVPAGPHDQEIALDGEDFDEEAIAALRAGNTANVEGYTFVPETA